MRQCQNILWKKNGKKQDKITSWPNPRIYPTRHINLQPLTDKPQCYNPAPNHPALPL